MDIPSPFDRSHGDGFGDAVAISADGKVVAVAGPGDDVGIFEDIGSVRVFQWSAQGWVSRGNTIYPSSGESFDAFGSSVALSSDGNTLIVGSPNHNNREGSAYIFDWNGIDWIQRGNYLSMIEGRPLDLFGSSVSISGDGLIAVIGCPNDYTTNTSSFFGAPLVSQHGSAWVFKWNGVSWEIMGDSIRGSNGGVSDYGRSVHISRNGTNIIINSQNQLLPGSNIRTGSAAIFYFNGNDWIQRGNILPSAYYGNGGAAFNSSVSFSADGLFAIVGSPASGQGSARVFSWNGVQWGGRGNPLTPADGNVGDQFGASVALSADGSTAIIGGPRDDIDGHSDQGAARVFDWNGREWVQRGGTLTPIGAQAGARFGSSVALSSDGDTAFLGGPMDIIDGNMSGSVRVFSWDGLGWVENTPLFANLAISSTSAAKGEGNSGNTSFTFTVTRSGVMNLASNAD